MSTARRRLKSLSGASANPTMVTPINIMVMNGWLTSFSFHVNQPSHSRYKVFSDFDLETPRLRSWVWSRGKFIHSTQYHINSFPFHFTSIRPTIPEMQLFRNFTLKHPRSRSKVKVTYCTHYPIDAFLFRFTSIGPTIPGQNSVWPWKNPSEIFKENLPKKDVSNKTVLKYNQVITTNRGIKAARICSDPMSGSHIIVQTNTFMPIGATAVTLVQGHEMVI